MSGMDGGETRELKERVVEINRVAKVVKGGRRFSFTALVVIGDEVDRVGVGYGKAREVPLAISKAVDDAKKNLFTVAKHGATITHEVLGQFDAARVLLRPASPGTGVIAGGGVRAVLELGGVRDVLAKSLGTTNPINMLKAAETALRQLRRPRTSRGRAGRRSARCCPTAPPWRSRSRTPSRRARDGHRGRAGCPGPARGARDGHGGRAGRAARGRRRRDDTAPRRTPPRRPLRAPLSRRMPTQRRRPRRWRAMPRLRLTQVPADRADAPPSRHAARARSREDRPHRRAGRLAGDRRDAPQGPSPGEG